MATLLGMPEGTKPHGRARPQAPVCLASTGTNPGGKRVVDRSTPERSAPVKSVSRRIATPRSAPRNFAPFTLARRRLTLRSWARSKFTLERSQRKNSMPLACASLKSAPGRIASVISAFRRSALRRLAPERSAPGSFAFRRSVSSRLAWRKMAPLRFAPRRSTRDNSALVRSARAPSSRPRKKRSCASRISVSCFPLCLMFFGFRKPIVSSPPVYNEPFYWKALRTGTWRCPMRVARARNLPRARSSWTRGAAAGAANELPPLRRHVLFRLQIVVGRTYREDRPPREANQPATIDSRVKGDSRVKRDSIVKREQQRRGLKQSGLRESWVRRLLEFCQLAARRIPLPHPV